MCCFKGAPNAEKTQGDHAEAGQGSHRGGGPEATVAYLNKDNSSNGFEDQHDRHGEGIDAGVVPHVRVVPHAVAHEGLISSGHSGVLLVGKAG